MALGTLELYGLSNSLCLKHLKHSTNIAPCHNVYIGESWRSRNLRLARNLCFFWIDTPQNCTKVAFRAMLVVVEDISPEQSTSYFSKIPSHPVINHYPLREVDRDSYSYAAISRLPPQQLPWYSHDLQWTLKPADHLRLFSFLAVLGLQVAVFFWWDPTTTKWNQPSFTFSTREKQQT